jgi:hypothetical protein
MKGVFKKKPIACTATLGGIPQWGTHEDSGLAPTFHREEHRPQVRKGLTLSSCWHLQSTVLSVACPTPPVPRDLSLQPAPSFLPACLHLRAQSHGCSYKLRCDMWQVAVRHTQWTQNLLGCSAHLKEPREEQGWRHHRDRLSLHVVRKHQDG